MDSTCQITPRDLEIINELLSWVTHNSTAQTTHWDSKFSKKLVPRVTLGFDSVNIH